MDLSFSGNYFNGSFGTTDNSLTIKWYWKEKNAAEWTLGGTLVKDTDFVINNNVYHSGTTEKETKISLGNIFDYKKTYEIKIEYSDALLKNNSITLLGRKGKPVYNWGGDFFNINGELRINNTKFIQEEYNELHDKTYSCNYLNKQIINISYCKMRTNFGNKTINSNSTLLTGWESVFQSGDIVSEPDENRIKVTNTSCLRLSGQISGQGNTWVTYKIYQKVEIGPDLPYTEEEIDDSGMGSLYQLGSVGNGYWSAPLPSVLVSLSETATYYIYLYVSPYNGQNMEVNNGFSKRGTYICAEKIK